MQARPGRDAALWAAIGVAPLLWLAVLAVKATAPPAWSGPWPDPMRLMLLGLVYPVLEEATFRGWLQGGFAARPWGVRRCGPLSAANLAACALFALAHLLWHSPLHALAVVPPGLVFGYFRDRDGTLARPIGLHVYYNIGHLLLWPGQ